MLTAKRLELRKPASQRLSERNERLRWFGSEVRRGGEAPHLTQRESKRRNLSQSGLNLSENAPGDSIRRHERDKNRDVRGNAKMDRGVEAATQGGNASLGLGHTDDECGFEH